jgi:deferrochelatase/peroxidase EfeB
VKNKQREFHDKLTTSAMKQKAVIVPTHSIHQFIAKLLTRWKAGMASPLTVLKSNFGNKYLAVTHDTRPHKIKQASNMTTDSSTTIEKSSTVMCQIASENTAHNCKLKIDTTSN